MQLVLKFQVCLLCRGNSFTVTLKNTGVTISHKNCGIKKEISVMNHLI